MNMIEGVVEMSYRRTFQHIAVALSIAAVSSLFATSISFAQSATGPQVLRVETPSSGARVNGNITFTGIAVDCNTAQPASRVAVYDGPSASNPYLADVSMDTSRPLAAGCANLAGSGQIGFTLIMDSNRLLEGRHTLAFVATYANGITRTVTTDIDVDNLPTRDSYRYPTSYMGVFYGGYYYNGIYTPTYTRCTAYSATGICLSYQVVNSPVVTPAVYPGCVTNVYGNCVAYPSSSSYYPYTYLNSLYSWNGVAWVHR
jgi:hypothetical protein